jgi:hypothetical protein
MPSDSGFCVKRDAFVKQEIPSEYRDNGITHKNASICFTFFIANIVHFTVCNCSHKNCINGEKRAQRGKQNSFFIKPIIIFSLCTAFICAIFFFLSFKICYSFVSLMNRNLSERNMRHSGRKEVHIKQKQNNLNLKALMGALYIFPGSGGRG